MKAGLILAAALAVVAPVHFTVFAHTDLRLGAIVWTGRDLLVVEENTGKIEASDAAGHSFRPFTTIDPGGEEMRCVASTGLYWPAGDVYCHTADNRIVRAARDGSKVVELARLPGGGPSDGALAFDTGGRFGYALLAATGGSSSNGGSVYSIRRNGAVTLLGSYPGPGGADEIAIAPARFGAASRRLLLSIDQDRIAGRLLAFDRGGAVSVVVDKLGNGLNPLAVVAPPPKKRAAGSPAAGLYVTDTVSMSVLFAPAAQFATLRGAVIVGTELTGQFWAVRASGARFTTTPLPGALPPGAYNLEGAVYIPCRMSPLTRRYHVPSALRVSSARIDPDVARELLDRGALLVDVRREDDPAVSIAGAVRIPPDEIPARLAELPRDTPIVLACA